MLIGLNPIMGSDLIYGQNDSFVLAWIVLSLWLVGARRAARGTGRGWLCLRSGLRPCLCASKPTAWFLARSTCLLLAGGDPADLWRSRWHGCTAWRGSLAGLAGGLS